MRRSFCCFKGKLGKTQIPLFVFPLCVLLVLLLYCHHKLLILEQQQSLLQDQLQLLSMKDDGGGGSAHLTEMRNNYDGQTSGGKRSSLSNEIDVIIYNRIPKTGSTSLMGVAYAICSKNGFNVIHVNTTKNSHTMSPADQIRFAQNITQWTEKRPALYHGHVSYIDFASLGVSLRPIYINVVRNPLDRLVSYYYFLRFGDDFRPEVVRKRKGNKETFDECVTRGGPDCSIENLWMQIPFFCGQHSVCWEPGSAWALQQAKANLAKSYFLVGLTENLEDFVSLLEAALPSFFRNGYESFLSDGKSHLRRTTGKQEPLQETINLIHKSKIWQMEQDFYMFAKKHFNQMKKKFLPIDGSPVIPQAFHYEKIRPRK